MSSEIKKISDISGGTHFMLLGERYSGSDVFIKIEGTISSCVVTYSGEHRIFSEDTDVVVVPSCSYCHELSQIYINNNDIFEFISNTQLHIKSFQNNIKKVKEELSRKGK